MDDIKELRDKVSKTFKGCKTKRLEQLIDPVPRIKETIKAGTLILIPVIRGSLHFNVLEKDIEAKHFHIPLTISALGKELGISNKYLQWFLTRDYVTEFLSKIATGSVQPIIPKRILFSIPVPIPKTIINETPEDEILLKNNFRNFIHEYYEQYQFNFNNKKFNTCSILAGVVSEAILYQLLIDNNVSKRLLDNDPGLGLGKLLTYVELIKLDTEIGFETQHFKAINSLRNNAVHFGVVRRSGNFQEVTKDSLKPFDEIIKQFGI